MIPIVHEKSIVVDCNSLRVRRIGYGYSYACEVIVDRPCFTRGLLIAPLHTCNQCALLCRITLPEQRAWLHPNSDSEVLRVEERIVGNSDLVMASAKRNTSHTEVVCCIWHSGSSNRAGCTEDLAVKFIAATVSSVLIKRPPANKAL